MTHDKNAASDAVDAAEHISNLKTGRNYAIGLAFAFMASAAAIHHVSSPDFVSAHASAQGLQKYNTHKPLCVLNEIFFGLAGLGFAGAAVKSHRDMKAVQSQGNDPAP